MADDFAASIHTGHPPVWPNYIDRTEDSDADDTIAESVSLCPVCGDPVDYCQGHGQSGDPVGASILSAHDDGYHGRCHPAGCENRADMIESIQAVNRFPWERNG